MNRQGHENAVYFIAGEVEKTPAFAKRTLFVVGFQDTAEILKLAKEHKTPHIFLGANHSFDAGHNTTEYFKSTWDKQITELLDAGFMVTLDYQAHQHKTVLQMLNPGIWQSRNFIPLLSVRIPCIETSSVNLTVKFDDSDFKETNAGVWCMNYHEVTDSNRFTGWEEYALDEIVSVALTPEKVSPIETKVYKDESSATGTASLPVTLPISDIKNEPDLGLDTSGVSLLKPDENAPTDIAPQVEVKTVTDAVEAYTAGTKTDPLSAEASKKTKVKK